ncbi:hypothetical protein KBD20_02245 [Candidatus Saccharibacteria bacterium]|nr:hypothetical protein [Candidatus Saccharibacteria bacterium]
MKNKQFSGQFEGEEILLVFRRHPIVMRKGFYWVGAGVILGALVGVYTTRNITTMSDFFVQFFSPVGLGLVLGLLGFFYYWIGWYYSVCIVTDQRFVNIRQTGIFRQRSVNDINLPRILSVNYEVRGFFETVLGFGTIIIQTLVGDFVIKNVPKPAITQAHIVTAIKESGVVLDEEISAS